MKNIKSFLAIILSLIFIFSSSAYAGDGNISGGGGEPGKGGNFWNAGWDGLRVSVFEKEKVNGEYKKIGRSFDISNKDFTGNYFYSTYSYSKLEYLEDPSLFFNNISYRPYKTAKPTSSMGALPYIIKSKNYGMDIDETKRYLESDYMAKFIANAKDINGNKYVPLTYDQIIDTGKYTVMVEPICYFTFQDEKYAFTGTEVALYDYWAETERLNGNWIPTIISEGKSVSHVNLPFAMFLEEDAMGIPAYHGVTDDIPSGYSKLQWNEFIYKTLSAGIIDYSALRPTEPEIPQELFDPANQGIRISVFDNEIGKQIGNTLDYTKKAVPTNARHWAYKGKHNLSKLQWLVEVLTGGDNGFLNATIINNSYHLGAKNRVVPDLPQIIYKDGEHMDEIKNYILNTNFKNIVLEDLASSTGGLDETDFKSGRYSVIIEPLVQFNYSVANAPYIMSATDLALFSELRRATVGYKEVDKFLGEFNILEMPFSMYPTEDYTHIHRMFLEWIYPTDKPTNGYLGMGSYNDIHRNLGFMVLEWEQNIIEPPVPKPKEMEVYEGKEVVLSTKLMSEYRLDATNPATVTFKLGNNVIGKQTGVVVPANKDTYTFIKWTVPEVDEQTNVQISIETNRGHLYNGVINVTIKPLDFKQLPDPQSDDERGEVGGTKFGNLNGAGEWIYEEDDNAIDFENVVSNSWYTYSSLYDEDYNLELLKKNNYEASINPKWNFEDTAPLEFRSGYGFETEALTYFSTDAPDSHITNKPLIRQAYPEFNYEPQYSRVLQPTQGANKFGHKENEYSPQNLRVHFTPVWYPDGEYTVSNYAESFWTPAGELKAYDGYTFEVEGSVFDDYSSRPLQ